MVYRDSVYCQQNIFFIPLTNIFLEKRIFDCELDLDILCLNDKKLLSNGLNLTVAFTNEEIVGEIK